MHILILPSWYPTKEDPVRGSFFAEQAEALAAFGHRVSVFPVLGDADEACRVERTEKGNLTEYAIHVRPLRFHLTYFRILGAMAGLIRGLPPGERPDIVHVHSFRAVRYARGLQALFSLPYVVTEHVSWFERGMLSEKQKRAAGRAYAGAAAVIAVGNGLKRQIQPLCPREVRVIPNLVNGRILDGELRRPGGESFRFISVGSFDENKGMGRVLSAFAAASEHNPRLRLTLVGDGEEKPDLERRAEALGLRETVTFTGQVPREECARLLRDSQGFVLASRVETFGLSAAEAMACGLPVIMTKTGAWESFITPATGLAVEIDDIQGLSEAMLRMAERAESWDPRRIRDCCRESFSAEAVCRRLTELYEEVLGERT